MEFSNASCIQETNIFQTFSPRVLYSSIGFFNTIAGLEHSTHYVGFDIYPYITTLAFFVHWTKLNKVVYCIEADILFKSSHNIFQWFTQNR